MTNEHNRTEDEMVRKLRAGANGAELAREYGMTRAGVNYVKQKHGIKNVRQSAMEHYPWPGMQRPWSNLTPNQRLKDYLEWRYENNCDMSYRRRLLLRRWIERMNQGSLVLEFDPNTPPHNGAMHGGFTYRKRVTSDGDLIIRVNEHTELTRKGRMLLKRTTDLPVLDKE